MNCIWCTLVICVRSWAISTEEIPVSCVSWYDINQSFPQVVGETAQTCLTSPRYAYIGSHAVSVFRHESSI